MRPVRRRPSAHRCPRRAAPGAGPRPTTWRSSLDRAAYERGVRRIRDDIERGEVYQANLCRVLTAPARPRTPTRWRWPPGWRPATRRPTPPSIQRAGPERRVGLARAVPVAGRRRRRVRADQGHRRHRGRPAGQGLRRERDDRRPGPQRPRPGRAPSARSSVPALCAVEEHPGLVHLVSTVRARLAPGAGWPELLAATFPPGSVTGAPKSSALRIIDELEPSRAGRTAGRRLGRRRPAHGGAGRGHPHLLDRPATRCASARARASPGAPTPGGSGTRPS